MADSQLILELLFLQRRGGCSLTVSLFFLMLVGTCCFFLSASLCVVRPTSFNNKAITSCFYAVKPRVVYSTRVMLPSAKKDSVPTTQKSCVVYEFSCRYEARYIVVFVKKCYDFTHCYAHANTTSPPGFF